MTVTNTSTPKHYQDYVRQHLDQLIEHGRDSYGTQSSRMWMSSIDLNTLRYPDEPLPLSGRRAYRDIHAPYGCSLYMDLPQIVAAVNLSELLSDHTYRESCQHYMDDYFNIGVADNGLILWGHHFYYDAFQDKLTPFVGAELNGYKHEMRPHSAPWELMQQWFPNICTHEIKGLLLHCHQESGSFDRHAHPTNGLQNTYNRYMCSFLEAGACIASSLYWAYDTYQNEHYKNIADKTIAWSFRHRGKKTGLLRNNPAHPRWDFNCTTTEIGVWALHILEAYRICKNKKLLNMADYAMKRWLKYAWSSQEKKFIGKVNVSNGKIIRKQSTLYQPDEFSDIWLARFPSHDYPFHAAEACLALYELTSHPHYKTAIKRWAHIIATEAAPATCHNGYGPYAESYGRAIRFLRGAAQTLSDKKLLNSAYSRADEAISKLWYNDMFRGHVGEDRYEASDGVGWLLIALLELQNNKKMNQFGMIG